MIWLDCRLLALMKSDFLLLAVVMVVQLGLTWALLLDLKSRSTCPFH